MKTAFVKALLLILAAQAMFFSNRILAAGLAVVTGGMTNAAPVFQVTALPEPPRVHIKETFKISLEVKNISHTNQSFTTMLCSWQDNWRWDNHQISVWAGYMCTANRPITVSLAPGESWKKELKMWVPDNVPTNHVSFKMSFTPLPFIMVQPHFENGKAIWKKEIKTETYWSNQSRITINPSWIPDWISW